MADRVFLNYNDEKRLPCVQIITQLRIELPLLDCYITAGKEKNEDLRETFSEAYFIINNLISVTNIKNRRVQNLILLNNK